jgi:hypothetical protein
LASAVNGADSRWFSIASAFSRVGAAFAYDQSPPLVAMPKNTDANCALFGCLV